MPQYLSVPAGTMLCRGCANARAAFRSIFCPAPGRSARPALLFFLGLIACPIALVSAQTPRVKAPYIPAGVNAAERAALTKCQLSLSQGKFDQVTARLTPLMPAGVVPVFFDWLPIPAANRAGVRQSAASAIQSWNSALGGSVRFQLVDKEEAADLKVFFERGVVVRAQAQEQGQEGQDGNGAQVALSCADVRLALASGKRRAGEARIALNVPHTDQLHSAASMTHLFGQALGLYLGLTTSEKPGDVMGPDTHAATVARTPSAVDVARAQELMRARATLAALAKRRVAAYLPKALLAVDKEEIDAGDVQRGDKARFVFMVKNQGDSPLELDAHPTCGCTVADYDKVVPPGGTGKIDAEVNTQSFRGKITKVIELRSNDLGHKLTNLRLSANVLSALTVLPGEVVNVPLKETEATVRELEIRAKSPVEVTRVACTVPYVMAKLEKVEGAQGGYRDYKVILTIQPEAPTGRSAFLVTVMTTSPKEPQINITTVCEKGIVVMPPSLYMGNITPSTALPLTTMFTLSRGAGAFHIKKVSTDDPNLQIKQEAVQEGRQYRLTVTYKGGWAAGNIRSKITVQTDDPQQSEFEVPVMGQVSAR